jgi:hypothetical protein
MLVAGVFKSLLVESIGTHFGLDPWTNIMAKAIITTGIGASTIRMYTSVS